MEGHNLSDEDFDGPLPPRRSRYTINGKPCSRSAYYVHTKRVKDAHNAECKAKFNRHLNWYELRDKLAQQLSERQHIQKYDSQSIGNNQHLYSDNNASSSSSSARNDTNIDDSVHSPMCISPPHDPNRDSMPCEIENIQSDGDVIDPDPLIMPSLTDDVFINNEVYINDIEGMLQGTDTSTAKVNTTEICEGIGKSDVLKKKLRELHAIFTRNRITLNGQKMILKFMKTLPPELLPMFPIDGRTLRPPTIKYLRRLVKPGVLAYWGIEQMLNLGSAVLFNQNCNAIELYANMDGLPLYHTPRGKGFWPILACVGDHPVFIIGAYEGRRKPECANNYIREFVNEVKKLTTGGVIVNGRTYRFRLKVLVLDGPAVSMLTGVKHPGGCSACRRCSEVGVMVWHVTKGEKNTKKKRRMGIRYPTLNGKSRCHTDFIRFAESHADPHEQNFEYMGNCLTDDVLESKHEKKDNLCPGENSNGHIVSDNEIALPSTSEVHPHTRKRCHGTSKTRKKGVDRTMYHMHPTILTEIPGFDIVKDVILDFMHIVGGHVKALLEYFNGSGTSGAIYKLSSNNLGLIDKRLIEATKFTPHEFERKPDSIYELPSWKYTQFRQFLLYIGPVVLHEALEDIKLQHLNILVVTMRLLCRYLPREPSLQRGSAVVQKNAAMSRQLLQSYFQMGNDLYGKNFSRYLAHHVPHIPDDYERFEEPLDKLSAFRFENANGQVKRLITGHFEPLTQLINKVTSLLHTDLYGRCEKNRVVYIAKRNIMKNQLFQCNHPLTMNMIL